MDSYVIVGVLGPGAGPDLGRIRSGRHLITKNFLDTWISNGDKTRCLGILFRGRLPLVFRVFVGLFCSRIYLGSN